MIALQLSETQQLELSAEALAMLAEYAAENPKYEPDLLNALYELGIPSVTDRIAGQVGNEGFPVEMVTGLWDKASPDVRYRLICNRILRNLTKKQMDDIITDNHDHTLEYVARNFEYTKDSKHLEESDRKNFLEFLRRHPNKGVREAVACNYYTAELLKKWGLDFSLKEMFELNVLSDDLLKKHKVSAIMQCVPLSSDNLTWLSENIGEFENQIKKRNALAQLLIDSKDPQPRQNMAKSPNTPRDILQMLADGEDPVAARYARINLAENYEKDEEDEEDEISYDEIDLE